MAISDDSKRCDYCERADGKINRVVIGTPNHLHVHECQLHEACEQPYLRLLDE